MSNKKKLTIDEDLASLPQGAFDQNNPHSLINMLPDRKGGLRERLIAVSDTLSNSTFEELKESMEENTTEQERKVTESIRLSFWYEHKMAMAENRPITEARVFGGFCGHARFKTLIKRPETAAYIFTRPAQEDIKLQRVIDKGYDRLEEVLSLPLTNWKGQPDYKLIKEIREITKMADNRKNGGVIQKVHQTSLNANYNTNSDKDHRNLTPEEIDRQLLELQKQMNPNAKVIEVDAGRRPETVEVEAIGTPTEESEA